MVVAQLGTFLGALAPLDHGVAADRQVDLGNDRRNQGCLVKNRRRPPPTQHLPHR